MECVCAKEGLGVADRKKVYLLRTLYFFTSRIENIEETNIIGKEQWLFQDNWCSEEARRALCMYVGAGSCG